MTNPHGEKSGSTHHDHFKEDTLTDKPQADKTHCWQNWTIGETELQNPNRREKAPGLSNGWR
ncbi:MAG: hypothetical protein QM730_04140 [Anaerolineales bacterium]